MLDIQKQAITGVIPPTQDEAIIRERFPTTARVPAAASLGRALTRTILLAPVAWLIMGLFYALKVAPFFMKRYTLTNRRVMIRSGWAGKPTAEVALADIDSVVVTTDANSNFFRSGTIEIKQGDTVKLTLPACQEPESFRHAIINACAAWVPEKAKLFPFIPAKS